MINQLLISGIIAGSIYAFITLGFVLIYRTVKFFHFAYGLVYDTERERQELKCPLKFLSVIAVCELMS